MTRNWTFRSRLTPWAILLALAVVALFLRLYRLHELAPGLKFDEGWNGIYALQVLQGEHALTFGDKDGLGVYLIALATKLLGRTPLALRLPTALASVAGVFALFWLGRLLFGCDELGRETRWRGLVIGGLASCLLAVSLGPTILGRTSYRASFLPLFLVLCFAALWWGWTRRRWWGIVLAGVCAGLLPYTYIPSRFVPFLFLFFGLSFLRPFCSMTRMGRQTHVLYAATFVGVTGLVAAPILFHYIRHPELFFNKHIQWLFAFGDLQDTPVPTLMTVLAANAWQVLSQFSFRILAGCCSPFRHAVTLNIWEASFFWLGVGIAAWQWKRSPALRLLLLWMGVLTLPAILSDAKSTMRMVGALPAIYLLVAVGVWETYQWSASRMLARAKTWPLLFSTVFAVIVLMQGTITHRSVFEKAMAGSYYQYDMIWPAFAQTLNTRPAESDTVYFIAHRRDAFDYIYHGETPVIRIFSAVPDLDQEVEEILTELDTVFTVKVVNWVDWSPTIEWRANFRADFLSILLDKHARYVGTENFDGIHVDTYVDISRDRPWVLLDDLPSPVIYDGGITLEGFALGSSKLKLPQWQRFDAGQNRSLKVGMLWKTLPDLAVDFAISLRLYDLEGERVFQRDHVLREATRFSRTTSRWGKLAVGTVFELEIPNDLGAGEYELRLVVYDLKTLIPTVEIEVWEPETTLGSVQLQ